MGIMVICPSKMDRDMIGIKGSFKMLAPVCYCNGHGIIIISKVLASALANYFNVKTQQQH